MRATFFVRALRDARFASKKNLLFRAAKHAFIWFVSLSRDKEMNREVAAKGSSVRATFIPFNLRTTCERNLNSAFCILHSAFYPPLWLLTAKTERYLPSYEQPKQRYQPDL
jgi:hypothetical protein